MGEDIVRLDYIRPPSLLTVQSDAYTALQLGEKDRRAYYPLNVRFGQAAKESPGVYAEEMEILNAAVIGKPGFFYDALRHALFPRSERIYFSISPLNVSNAPQDVRFRQEAIKEVCENHDLAQALEKFVLSNALVSEATHGGERGHFNKARGQVSPDRVVSFYEGLAALEAFNPRSAALQRAVLWGRDLQSDALLRYQREKVEDVYRSLVVIGYGRRNKGARAYLVPPGVDLDNILIPLHTEVLSAKQFRNGKTAEQRDLFKYLGPEHKEHTTAVVGQGVTSLNALNEITARMMAIPAYILTAQLHQFVTAARWHAVGIKAGLPMIFPDIVDEHGYLDAKQVYAPTLFAHAIAANSRSTIKPIDLELPAGATVLGIEGRNKAGKSESGRTLDSISALVNMGASIPARAITAGPVPHHIFFSFRDTERYYGSAFEGSLKTFFKLLSEVYPGTRIVLDEFGDATNEPTGEELARRLLPLMQRQECQVILTTQHAAARKVLRDLGGTSLTPAEHPSFELQPINGPVDYKPQETLDSLQATVDKLAAQLPLHSRANPPLPYVAEDGTKGRSMSDDFMDVADLRGYEDPNRVSRPENQQQDALEEEDDDLPF
jgi:hypothetical protein